MTELPVNFRKKLVKRHNVNYFVTKSVATCEAWNIASLTITDVCSFHVLLNVHLSTRDSQMETLKA